MILDIQDLMSGYLTVFNHFITCELEKILFCKIVRNFYKQLLSVSAGILNLSAITLIQNGKS